MMSISTISDYQPALYNDYVAEVADEMYNYIYDGIFVPRY
jgi:hypothetical protein